MSYFRGEDGFGLYVHSDLNVPTSTAVYVTEAGEIWGIDAFTPSNRSAIFLPVSQYAQALDQYRAFLLDKLNIDPPYQLEMGIDGIKNQKVWLPTVPGRMYVENPVGACITNEIIARETIEKDTHSRDALKRFFQTILEKCGVENPEVMRNLFDPSLGN